jgi:hypothetical protein
MLNAVSDLLGGSIETEGWRDGGRGLCIVEGVESTSKKQKMHISLGHQSKQKGKDIISR